MNWEAIKNIYYWVLVRNNKIEYLGGDKYKLIEYCQQSERYYEFPYENERLCGSCLSRDKSGNIIYGKEIARQ